MKKKISKKKYNNNKLKNKNNIYNLGEVNVKYLTLMKKKKYNNMFRSLGTLHKIWNKIILNFYKNNIKKLIKNKIIYNYQI